MRLKKMQSIDEYIHSINGTKSKKVSFTIKSNELHEIYLDFMQEFNRHEISYSINNNDLTISYSETLEEEVKDFLEKKIKTKYKNIS